MKGGHNLQRKDRRKTHASPVVESHRKQKVPKREKSKYVMRGEIGKENVKVVSQDKWVPKIAFKAKSPSTWGDWEERILKCQPK